MSVHCAAVQVRGGDMGDSSVTWATVHEGMKVVVCSAAELAAGARARRARGDDRGVRGRQGRRPPALPRSEFEMLEAGACARVALRGADARAGAAPSALLPLAALRVDETERQLQEDARIVADAAAETVQNAWRACAARAAFARKIARRRAERRRAQELVVVAMAATAIQAQFGARAARRRARRPRAPAPAPAPAAATVEWSSPRASAVARAVARAVAEPSPRPARAPAAARPRRPRRAGRRPTTRRRSG